MLRRLLFLVVLVVPLVVWGGRMPQPRTQRHPGLRPRPIRRRRRLTSNRSRAPGGLVRSAPKPTRSWSWTRTAMRQAPSGFAIAGRSRSHCDSSSPSSRPQAMGRRTTRMWLRPDLSLADAMTKAVVADDAPLQPKAAFDVTINAANLRQPGPSCGQPEERNREGDRPHRAQVRRAFQSQGRWADALERAELPLEMKRATYLTLHNDDPDDYRFRWYVHSMEMPSTASRPWRRTRRSG